MTKLTIKPAPRIQQTKQADSKAALMSMLSQIHTQAISLKSAHVKGSDPEDSRPTFKISAKTAKPALNITTGGAQNSAMHITILATKAAASVNTKFSRFI